MSSGESGWASAASGRGVAGPGAKAAQHAGGTVWVPVVLWMAAIFAASSQPALPAAAEHVWDKLLHGGAYGVLGALVLRGLSGRWRRPVSIRMAATAVLMAALYGASDEVHQHFVPPRQMDARDAVADTAGAALAGAALYGWSASARRRPTKAAIISSRDGL